MTYNQHTPQQEQEQGQEQQSNPNNFVVVIPTFYTSTEDVRFHLCLETLKQAVQHKIHVIVVDASPSPEIRQQLSLQGRSEDYVQVHVQTYPGRKGAALREAIDIATKAATSSYNNNNENGKNHLSSSWIIIAFQEPEKADLMRQWKHVIQHMQDTQSDICIPRRLDTLFAKTYPLEQYVFRFNNNDEKEDDGEQNNHLDWLFGPIAWRCSFSHHWSEYSGGDLWDVQLVPLVQAHRWDSAKITSCTVEYSHPVAMKEEEENSPQWMEKRMMQLHFLFDKLGKAFKESKAEYENHKQHQQQQRNTKTFN